MLSCHFKSLGSLDIAACLHCKRGHLSAAWTDQLLISFLQKSEASIYMHLECVFISEMDKNGIFVWWLIHHSQIECCVCQRSGMECHVYAEKRNRKYCYRISWNIPTSQFSCMIPWLIHTSTNRLLHQGAAFWLWDQCRQRDKVLLQVGRLIEEEIDSWWWSGGWCVIVIVAMLSELLYPWQTELTCLPFSSEHFCNTATKIENGPTKLLLILLHIGHFVSHMRL